MPFTMQFLPDEPIATSEDDLLGLGDFVDLIQNAIANTQTPFVYGVLGDWGVGKTSILRLLQARYHDIGSHGVVCIWFNAWEYENEKNLVYPLLYAIKQAYQRDMIKPHVDTGAFLTKLREVVGTSALVLGDIGLRASTRLLSGEAIKLSELQQQLKEVRQHQDTLEEVFSQWADSVGQLKEAFAELLRLYAEGIASVHGIPAEKVRFLILIDDLDRCLPDTTIAILESIKNHLSAGRAIYMLGLNARVVYQGIRHKYSGLDINGREYLEKILNYTFYVPEPDMEAVEKFAHQRINQLVTDQAELKTLEPFVREFGKTLKQCNFNNPRKIKRILNRYLLFLNKYAAGLDRYPIPNIVRLLIIAEYFPELFQLLLSDTERYADQIKHLIRLRDLDRERTTLISMREFEDTTGVRVAGIFPQLARMRNLFEELREQSDINKPKLREQVQAVFSITRLI